MTDWMILLICFGSWAVGCAFAIPISLWMGTSIDPVEDIMVGLLWPLIVVVCAVLLVFVAPGLLVYRLLGNR